MIDPQKIKISPIAKTGHRNLICNFQYLKIAIREIEKSVECPIFPKLAQDMKARKSKKVAYSFHLKDNEEVYMVLKLKRLYKPDSI